MVFAWHFMHYKNGYPVPFDVSVPWIISVFDEGHTGVALFMTLSGYLFAKLLGGRSIDYAPFLWNRALRLLPLLTLVLAIVGFQRIFIEGASFVSYGKAVAAGVLLPSLPNGGWSITVEAHFYLLLPLLLWLSRLSKWILPAFVVLMILVRFMLYAKLGEIQTLAYWTIVGRVDQFLLGIIAFQCRSVISKPLVIMIIALAGLTSTLHVFNLNGGFYNFPSYPSPSSAWVVLPSAEGLCYALLIASYDVWFKAKGPVSLFISKLGSYSYSIYLLHFFVVFRAAEFIHERVMDISDVWLALAWSLICYVAMMPIGYLSFRFIESPFLRFRKRYVRSDSTQPLIHSELGRAVT